MDQMYHQSIGQTHELQYMVAVQQRTSWEAAPKNPTLRSRSLLYLSDLLIALGNRLRPTDFRVDVHGMQAREGILEINAKGC
jgi:hypothetical protein